MITLQNHTNTMNPYIMKISLFLLNTFFHIIISNKLYPVNNSEKKKFIQSIPTVKLLYSFGMYEYH